MKRRATSPGIVVEGEATPPPIHAGVDNFSAQRGFRSDCGGDFCGTSHARCPECGSAITTSGSGLT
jgi:hypothetical protein